MIDKIDQEMMNLDKINIKCDANAMLVVSIGVLKMNSHSMNILGILLVKEILSSPFRL